MVFEFDATAWPRQRPEVPPMSRRTVALLLCCAALGTAALLHAPGAEAQSPGLYSLEGVVRDPATDPVAGATVTLVPVDASGGNRTTATGEDGRYAFRNLSEGTYDLVADAPCCGPDYRQVEVSGTQLSRSADLQLTDQAEPRGNETVILRGRTQELDGAEAVGGVRVQVRSFQVHEARDVAPEGSEDGPEPEDRTVSRREATFEARSDADGTYALELPPGRVDLEARKDGYDVSLADLQLDRHRRVDVPVRASETAAARLGGVLVSDEGEPVADAHVRVRWDPEDCEDRRCPEPPPDDASRESDGVRFHVEPAASRYDSTTTAADGRWNLSVHPGTVQLRARAPDHLPTREPVEVQGGEDRRVNLTLEAIPEDSVRLQGTVTGAETGDPVDRARVQVENHRWGTRNGTWTDEDGSYEMMVEPGYAVVTVDAGRERACVRAHGTGTAVARDEPAGDRSARTSVVRPEPCPDEEEQGREYLPRHRTLAPEAGEERTFSPSLRPAPARSATLRGWILNASSQEGIEGATLGVRNEVTGERGWATTDGDGSFRVNVTPGYYTLRTPVRQHRDAFFPAVRNVEVGPDETRTVALNLTPGTPRDRCCVVYGAVAVEDGASASGGQAGASGGAAPDGGTVRGSGGDLGPYDPSKLGSSQAGGGDERGAPAPGLVPAAAAALTAAAGLRAWRRQGPE